MNNFKKVFWKKTDMTEHHGIKIRRELGQFLLNELGCDINHSECCSSHEGKQEFKLRGFNPVTPENLRDTIDRFFNEEGFTYAPNNQSGNLDIYNGSVVHGEIRFSVWVTYDSNEGKITGSLTPII